MNKYVDIYLCCKNQIFARVIKTAKTRLVDTTGKSETNVEADNKKGRTNRNHYCAALQPLNGHQNMATPRLAVTKNQQSLLRVETESPKALIGFR